MAIGAAPLQIGRLVIGQSMAPVLTGILAGLAASLALNRFLESLLFQVRPHDPLALSLSTLAVLAISPIAVYIPLRRAMRVDCTIVLREE